MQNSYNGTEILDKLDEGDDLLGFDTMIILASDSPTAVMSNFVNEDCSYKYDNPSDNWKIFYYGLPK